MPRLVGTASGDDDVARARRVAVGFGDTLVDERWMRQCPADFPGWEEAWVRVMTELADAWNVGAVRSPEVFAALADRTEIAARSLSARSNLL
jgi:hypothetical protein